MGCGDGYVRSLSPAGESLHCAAPTTLTSGQLPGPYGTTASTTTRSISAPAAASLRSMWS